MASCRFGIHCRRQTSVCPIDTVYMALYPFQDSVFLLLYTGDREGVSDGEAEEEEEEEEESGLVSEVMWAWPRIGVWALF